MNQSGGPRQDETRDPTTPESIQDMLDGFTAGDEKATADIHWMRDVECMSPTPVTGVPLMRKSGCWNSRSGEDEMP